MINIHLGEATLVAGDGETGHKLLPTGGVVGSRGIIDVDDGGGSGAGARLPVTDLGGALGVALARATLTGIDRTDRRPPLTIIIAETLHASTEGGAARRGRIAQRAVSIAGGRVVAILTLIFG